MEKHGVILTNFESLYTENTVTSPAQMQFSPSGQRESDTTSFKTKVNPFS
jgi:hypothetical protein